MDIYDEDDLSYNDSGQDKRREDHNLNLFDSDADDDSDSEEQYESSQCDGELPPLSPRASALSSWLANATAAAKSGNALKIESPLPLLSFQSEASDIAKPLTITGEPIETILNKIEVPSSSAGLFGKAIPDPDPDRLQDPRHARGVGKYFAARCARELLARQANSAKDNSGSGIMDSSNDDNAAGDSSSTPNAEMPQLIDFCVYDERKKDVGGSNGTGKINKRDQKDRDTAKKRGRSGGSPVGGANLACDCDNPQQNPSGVLGDASHARGEKAVHI